MVLPKILVLTPRPPCAQGYFYQRLDQIAIAHGKTPVHWVEAFDALGPSGRLDKRVVIDVCPGPPNGMCGYSKTTIQDVVAAARPSPFMY